MRNSSPAPAALWGVVLLTLSPFPIAAYAYAYGPAHWAGISATVLLTYSATIQAFLGGVRWGLESAREQPRRERLVLSVVAPLIAWGLVLASGVLPITWALIGLLATFLLQWLFDENAPEVASRYPRLGTVLTLGACISMAVMLEKALRM